jgi:hypothetical protein
MNKDTNVAYHLERLRLEREHYRRCTDPEVCVDDKGPQETWLGCTGHVKQALRRLESMVPPEGLIA